jgi:anion-transporting  ArsA/GET3 family ATPase
MDFQNLYEGFKERAEEVLRLLNSDGTGFVVVTTLEGPPLEEAGFFVDRLVDERLPLAAIVANKVVPLKFADAPKPAARGGDESARYAARWLDTFSILAKRDKRHLAELEARSSTPVVHVPLLTHDVHDLETLAELGRHLLTSSSAG